MASLHLKDICTKCQAPILRLWQFMWQIIFAFKRRQASKQVDEGFVAFGEALNSVSVVVVKVAYSLSITPFRSLSHTYFHYTYIVCAWNCATLCPAVYNLKCIFFFVESVKLVYYVLNFLTFLSLYRRHLPPCVSFSLFQVLKIFDSSPQLTQTFIGANKR